MLDGVIPERPRIHLAVYEHVSKRKSEANRIPFMSASVAFQSANVNKIRLSDRI